MKYKIKIIVPMDKEQRLQLDSLLNRVATGFMFQSNQTFVIIKTDSIAWLSIAIELLEAGLYTWEAASGC